MIPDFLRPFLSALLMIPLLSLAGYATAHGITITNDQVHKAVDYLCEVGFPILAGLAVIFRRLVDKKANPDNAASTGAAAAGKAKQRQRKETRAIEGRLAQAGLKLRDEEIPPRAE